MAEEVIPRHMAHINFDIMMNENRYREAMARRGSKWHNQAENDARLTRLHERLLALYKEKKAAEADEGVADSSNDEDNLLERDFFEDMLRRKHEQYLELQRESQRQSRERKRERGFDMER